MKLFDSIESSIVLREFNWKDVDVGLARKNTKVLDLVREACLIESYFGLYIGKMIEMFKYDIEATSIFLIEGYEAYTHFAILKKYLETVDYRPITNEEVVDLRTRDSEIEKSDEIKELVNFMGSEHFSRYFFDDLRSINEEPVLDEILRKLSAMEVTHSKLAYELLEKRLAKDPSLKDKILKCASEFKHIGKYVFPELSNVKKDNSPAIREFNDLIVKLTGEDIRPFTHKMDEISEDELYILSYYRSCELAGAILFSKLAYNTEIDDLRINLTLHALEESNHSWWWTETIKKLGKIPLKITNNYQSEYGKKFGMPKNILEILCLTQVFEKRTIMHFRKHLLMKNLNPLIKDTLERMIADEEGHISWVRKRLDSYDPEEVSKVMEKLEQIDKDIYGELMLRSPFKEYFG